jgi:hypothetical protein
MSIENLAGVPRAAAASLLRRLWRIGRRMAAGIRRRAVSARETVTSRDIPRAIALIDGAMEATARFDFVEARRLLDEARPHLPALAVATHAILFETYHAIDRGRPLSPEEIVVPRHAFAEIVLGTATGMAQYAAGSASGAPMFNVWYPAYLREQEKQPKRITPYGYQSFSVSNDDGLIHEIFRRIGTIDRYFIEFGVQDGIQSNTTALLFEGWRGARLEAVHNYVVMGNFLFRRFIAGGALRNVHRFITAENINEALAAAMHPGAGPEIDLLSIDIDGNDYWVWQAIDVVRPRVVIAEYNSTYHPPVAITQPYDALGVHNGTSFYGASLEALCRLGQRKGYSLVGCSLVGDNAYFVRDDLVDDKFHAPGDAVAHFEPQRTGFPLMKVPYFGDWHMVE